ncbi:MAG: SDR family NAD(P)-dependent oxidoreductase, partial [Vicinamibacterales bacterium]
MSSPSGPDAPATASFPARLREVADLLEAIAGDRSLLADVPEAERIRLLKAAGAISRPDAGMRAQLVKAVKKRRKDARDAAAEAARANTGIRELRRKPVFTTPNVFAPDGFAPDDLAPGAEERHAPEPQHCYICKQHYTAIHRFYDQLCPSCAALNFRKRGELADLTGRVALLTGGRVKIGYQAGIKLLRCGASLIVTTRFPRDAAMRYAKEPDFAEWGHRLEVFGLDLRHTPSVEAFAAHLMGTRDRLDFIVNNACQTVRRPPEFYRHMMEAEGAALGALPEDVRRVLGAYEGLRGAHLLPEGPATSGALARELAAVSGLTRAAELSQVPLLP